jgi:hypothetical protein
VSHARRGLTALVVLGVAIAGSVGAWLLLHNRGEHTPQCSVPALGDTPPGISADFVLTPEQADNAATIAGVGLRLGMPDHAVTIALATALQESGLRNLPGGDRDSAGLFQQRPSQRWGTRAQVLDPNYAATAFYQTLRTQPGWTELSVTAAAQLVQHSAAPSAYADWEPEARATAAALTGETPATLTCRDLTITAPKASLVSTAATELGTTTLSGRHTSSRGWAIGSWLVAHASRLGIDRVTFDGRTWTATSGTWTRTRAPNGILTQHHTTEPTT